MSDMLLNSLIRGSNMPVQSIRDGFAMMALSGSLASQSIQGGYYTDYPDLAKQCYAIADAMMEARK